MNKMILSIVIFQSIIMLFLAHSSNKLQDKLNALLTNQHELAGAVKNTSDSKLLNDQKLRFQQSANNPLSTEHHNQAPECTTDKLQQLIQKLESQLKQGNNFIQGHNKELLDNTVNKNFNANEQAVAHSIVTAKVNDIISLGSMSEQDFFLLSQQASQLPKAQRDKLMKKLARELNQR